MLNRLELEVSQCKEEAPTILPTVVKKPADKDYSAAIATTEQETMNVSEEERTHDVEQTEVEAMDVATVTPPTDSSLEEVCPSCMPERVALIKSILNFLKKVLHEPTFAENIRNCKPNQLIIVYAQRRLFYHDDGFCLVGQNVTMSGLSKLVIAGLPFNYLSLACRFTHYFV